MAISIFNNACDLCVLLQKYTNFIVFSVMHNILKTCSHWAMARKHESSVAKRWVLSQLNELFMFTQRNETEVHFCIRFLLVWTNS